ncbi:Protein-disulfide isomerase [Terribacillus halophilus]|uniref:Protein-disulfide isomerase n=1 Tax=Terribacillus halophilus TaxID=361279 RepID=A0A1G6RFN1_9BACI|nr:DsbA family protein [Terribacillus halophilus]SDD02835.1 Protein-disulfide isomerase [Terribacillus halophilus]
MAKKKSAGNTSQAASKASKVIVWVVLAIVLLVVALVLINSYSGSDDAQDIDYSNQPFLGDENAPVKIVEFGDYKCIHCQEFHHNNFPVIDQELIETGKASFYFMNMPIINADSKKGARFSEAVYQVLGDDGFWKFHDVLFAEDLNTSFTEEFLMDKLREVVSDEEAEEVLQVYQDNGTDDAVSTDTELAKELDVQGTPTIFVNGKLFEGEDMNDLIEMVDEETQEAN